MIAGVGVTCAEAKMSEFRQTASIFVSTLALSVVGLSLVAQAQSPFAKKGKKQAWETVTPTQPAPTSQPSYQYPAQTQTQSSVGTYQPSGSLNAPAQNSSYPSSYNYQLPTASQNTAPVVSASVAPTASKPSMSSAAPQTSTAQVSAGASYDYPTYNQYGTKPASQPALRGSPTQANGAYYPGRSQNYTAQQQQQGYYPQQMASNRTQAGHPPQTRQRSWTERMGLGNLSFSHEGYLKAGVAGASRDTRAENGWGEDFILDGSLRGEVSAITRGGLEYGIVAEARGQYDQYRRGFGGRVGDCPAGVAGCYSTGVTGADNVLRGHTSRFYAAGANDAKDFEVQLESAHLFLRSAYGDVTIGRDDGAAYLFSLGAPTLLNVGASNNSVDYTGLDSVKTVNDASGFAEKVTYTSPRLLGDQIGVGVQFGASYALDAKACGVDYCVRGNSKEPAGVVAPDLDDIIELGVALDRKFANGMSVEATATYAMGSEQSTLDAFDDLRSLGLGVELGYMDWTLGGSYLHSNNGLANGDYTAMDVGLTWKPSKLGFTVGYGHAEDDNVGLTSDQVIAGVSYDWRENFRIGTGVQYINRDVNVNNAGIVAGQNEDATSIFLEGRFTF